MPYVLIEAFSAGLDTRRMAECAVPGSLRKCTNAHISRGGEIEKRRALTSRYTLPVGTFGVGVAAGALYTFGSGTDPGVPVGVIYQRLQHPSGQAMTRLIKAETFNGLLYCIAEYANGDIYHFYNGTRVTDWFDGRAKATFTVTGGTASAGVNKVTSVLVNGVEALSTAVDWTTDNATTAAAIASQINTYSSTPNYTATSSGNAVIMSHPSSDSSPNGWPVVVTVAGNVTVSPTSTTLSGGVTSGSTFTPGTTAKTVKSKVYSGSGSLLHFCAVNDPTHWTTGYTGASYINMANQAAGSEELTGLETYFDKLAVFARRAIQLWAVAADPAANTQTQVLRNTGTPAADSVKAFGDNDVFYLSDSGIRSIRARDSSNAAYVNDVGTAIDTLVQEAMAAESAGVVAAAAAVVDPVDGRFLMALGNSVYVFSFFPASKIAAWSVYDAGMQITHWAVSGSSVYGRSGNAIYQLGPEYDSAEVVVEVPYLSAGRPATFKGFAGIDAAAEGTWLIEANTDPLHPDDWEELARITGTTYGLPVAAMAGMATHIKLRFTSQAAGAARLGQIVVHYDAAESG